ncbi:MAG: hypothetical protein IPG72_11315 [Ardenticatenales bacterium]|nr:hypothetical protein [Ardenticatenales bacterium]
MRADPRPLGRLVDLPGPLPPPHPLEAARLRIRLFGPLVATYDGTPVRRPSRIDTERLWMRLLLGGGVPTPRATIAADLWPDIDAGPARFNLRFNLHHLHSALPPHDTVPWIVAGDDALHWNADAPAWIDLYAWADALARAAALVRDEGRVHGADAAPLPPEAADALARAIDLQTAVLLPDHDGPWAAAWRDAASSAHPIAVDRLVAHLASAGATDAALAVSARAVDLDPLDEAAHLRLITAHAAAGNRTAALQAYARAVDVLRDELGDEPSDELTALALSLHHESESGLVEAASTGADGPAAPSSAGARVRSAADRRNAAAQLQGRASDVEHIVARLATHRLVTITGPAGVGKSAVAEAVAAALEDAGRPIAWLDLAMFAPAHPLDRALDDAIRDTAPVADGPSAAEGAPDRVLVLDNADRFVEALGRHAPDVIARAPDVRLLITTRRPLALIGETRWSLRPFGGPSVDRASTDTDDVTRAVFLAAWWEGAAATARPAPSHAQRAAIDAIAQAVDGLPLGLVVAAHAARTLGLESVAASIAADPLAVVDPVTDDPRHGSLAAALAWTIDLLDAGDRGWLHRLAALHGPLAAADIEAVAEADGMDPMDALDALGRLVDAGWLLPDGVGDTAAERAKGYRVPAIVRRLCASTPTS